MEKLTITIDVDYEECKVSVASNHYKDIDEVIRGLSYALGSEIARALMNNEGDQDVIMQRVGEIVRSTTNGCFDFEEIF